MNVEDNNRMSEEFRADMLAGIDAVNARFLIEPDVSGQTLGTITTGFKAYLDRLTRRRARRAAITTYYNVDLQTATEQDLEGIEKYASAQSVIKRHPVKEVRRDNIMMKRANTIKARALGIDLVAENAHEHGSRAIRRKVAHDARKGTKPAPFGRGSVKLTDTDIVERHGRPALGIMSAERFQSALSALWEAGRRLDLKPRSEFQRTVDALADVMGRRVAV